MDDQTAAGCPPALLDLVERQRWQRLQDHFSNVLGIATRTVSPTHELLVNPSWPAGLPVEAVIERLRIGEELDELLPSGELLRDISSLTTSLGLTYAAVPIRVTSEEIVAYFVLGPMIVGPREDELQFRQRVSALGLDTQSLWPLMLSLKLYTFAGIRSVLSLLEEVATSLVQFAYQAKQLATILPPSSRADQAVISYYTNRVLESLLEAATLATKAEGGSVMVYDPRGELQIKAAHGLEPHVVHEARLRRGEGLAGLAVAERTILLVDEHTTDERIKSRMTRPELVSSLVAPLATEEGQEPFGVLSLRTSNRQRRFAQEHVELLHRLLDLAGAALGGLRLAVTTSRTPSLPPI